MFSTSAAGELSFNVVKTTDGITESAGVYSLGNSWADNRMYTDFALQAGKTYNLTFNTSVDNYSPCGISVMATSDPTGATITEGGKVRLVYSKGNKDINVIRPSVNFNADDIIDDTNKYLGLVLNSASDGGAIKNIVLREVPANTDFANIRATYEHGYWGVDDEGTCAYLGGKWYGWQIGQWDVEIDPNNTYTIEYEYKGKNGVDGGKGLAWTTTADGALANGGSAIGTTAVAHPEGNVAVNSYTKYTVKATGAELGATATNKYLTFYGHNVIADYINVRKVKVTEEVGPGGSGGGNTSSDSTSSDEGGSGSGSGNDQYKNDGFLHPTYKSSAITETLDATTVVYGSSAAISNGFMTFDTQLEAGAEYVIEMDMRGHRDSDTNRILIGAAAKDGTAFAGNTVVFEKGYSLNWSKYWHVGQVFAADDVISASGNYLALSVKSDQSCLMKNIKLTKVTKSGAYLYPTSDGEAVHPMAEDGVISYVNTHSYSTAAWMVFDYELKADTKYQVSFEYKGPANTCQGGVRWSITAANTPNVSPINTNIDSATVFSGKRVEAVKAAADNYTKISIMLDANDVISDGFKYLALVTSTYETHSGIRNLKIDKFETDGMLPVSYGNELIIGVEDGEVTLGTSVEYGDQGWMKFDYALEPNTEYLLSYDFRGHTWIDNGFPFFLGCVEDPYNKTDLPKNLVPENKRIGNIAVGNTRDRFTHKDVVFNSDDVINGNAKYICLAGGGYPDKWTFKNIRIMKKPALDGSNMLFNGDFDDDALGEQFWNDKANIGVRDNTQNHTPGGTHAFHITGGNLEKIYQSAVVEKDTKYELTFWYKGTFKGNAMAAISREVDTISRHYLVGYDILTDSADWKQYKTVINSGNYMVLAFNIVTGAGSDFFVDDIVLKPTYEEAIYNANTLIKEPAENTPEAEFRYQHYAAAEGANMFQNSTFETGDLAEWDLSAAGSALSIVDGEGWAGNNKDKTGKALKFEAKGLEKKAEAYIWFDVKPNTQYIFTMWSRTPAWSQDNTADLRWGFANPFDNESYYTFREDVRGYKIICNDDMWHRTTVGIDTKDNTRIAFAIKGANSTMYFDNLEFFENTAANKVDARPEVMKDVFLTERLPVVTNTAPTAIYVANSKNLIKNGSFDDADISFWNGDKTQGFKGSFEGKYVTLKGWDGTVEIADSKTSYGKALYYKSNDHITGAPLVTTYLNVMQVEKNTEYTFVADYLITEANTTNILSGFGLAAYNTWNPTDIGTRINFKTDYDPNLKWQRVAYTFNTKNYDEVAFFVVDGGGEAYIDNVSLFKTSDGSTTPVEDTPEVVEGKIESTEYDVVEDTITGAEDQKLIEGVEEGTTVQEILNTLKDKQNIKVFDAEGNEVTDTSVLVGTGYTFRYMDGISSVDSAVVLIRGDVTGDGVVNGADMKILMRAILDTGDVVLDQADMIVVDIYKDGMITSNDVALISAHIGGAKALEPVTVG